MTEDELVADFEAGSLPPARFGHVEHVRLAWHYLDRAPLLVAAQRFREGLRRYTRIIGVPEKYHETVTLAWLFLIHERRVRTPGADWETFRRGNPDLFDPAARPLAAYYRDETLADPLARRSFLLPDRGLAAPSGRRGPGPG